MKKTVAVDLDGVLAKYDGFKGVGVIGDPIPGAVDFTRKLSKIARVLIYTTRTNKQIKDNAAYSSDELVIMIKDYLDKHGFSYDRIHTGAGKPLAAAYVDDRAVNCRPMEDHPDLAFSLAEDSVKWLFFKA